jgi:cellulose synthase/poly-beta-1,6-N-acetylglucosamine synthase-like glycosyltransferase
MILVLHIASGAIFFAPTSLRLAAALSPPRRKPPHEPEDGARRPVYSILVALRQEDEVVGHLVRWLAALEWPRSKLEVFLVCEADDPDTIHAAREAIANEPGFEVVVVPVAQPRTKPKALNFALPLATGEFVVLFDAEDRPHPGQLEAAWRTFRTSDRRLACLQAELTIGNGRESWLSSLFAVEYATLFRGFLPWLAARGLPIPLGGTSNHFRREHLLSVGGWDSHNVTEDADLGIRLCRSGFKVAMLRSSTIEDAPTETRIWHRQRTRWMKGWMQTYLVHMRDPAALYRDLGPKGFWVLQILLIGMIGSAIAHPLFLILLGKAIAIVLYGRSTDLWMDVLLGIDLLNALGGVMAAVMLAMTTIRGPDRRHLLRSLVWIYPYWTLVSLSTARAFVELAKRPHHWAKTPHGLPFQPEDDTAARTEEDHAMRLEAPTSSGPETGIEGQTAEKHLATSAA